ncbi:MAG: hypothetical protein Q7K42_01930 [Candidatus Diapherotrites archaeon]|nr:hypothetical protein [Candidatus Diapherotrites archaeon]
MTLKAAQKQQPSNEELEKRIAECKSFILIANQTKLQTYMFIVGIMLGVIGNITAAAYFRIIDHQSKGLFLFVGGLITFIICGYILFSLVKNDNEFIAKSEISLKAFQAEQIRRKENNKLRRMKKNN